MSNTRLVGQKSEKAYLVKDIFIIILSILASVVLVKTGIITKVLHSTSELKILSSFIAGIFFTSVFTTTPAIVALGEIAHSNSILVTAFFGALGSVVGDLIIFRFVRDELSDHFLELMKHGSYWKRVKVILKLKYFRWFTFLLGGLIISSPLPDELAMSLFGFTKMKTKQFIPISFLFNFLGIIAIGIVAKSL